MTETSRLVNEPIVMCRAPRHINKTPTQGRSIVHFRNQSHTHDCMCDPKTMVVAVKVGCVMSRTTPHDLLILWLWRLFCLQVTEAAGGGSRWSSCISCSRVPLLLNGDSFFDSVVTQLTVLPNVGEVHKRGMCVSTFLCAVDRSIGASSAFVSAPRV